MLLVMLGAPWISPTHFALVITRGVVAIPLGIKKISLSHLRPSFLVGESRCHLRPPRGSMLLCLMLGVKVGIPSLRAPHTCWADGHLFLLLLTVPGII